MDKAQYDALRGHIHGIEHVVETMLTLFLSGMPSHETDDFLTRLAAPLPVEQPPAGFPWDAKSAERAQDARNRAVLAFASRVQQKLAAIQA
ncbi:hypothetical protein [Terricaulis sp.]|uniref:hypothetical protein n=1 Tax=Terricaulis sp. TaxID=2768686 RepID=UPI003783E9DA